MKKSRVYTLEKLAPEVRAVCFAKCSRSPESFDKIGKELNADKSRKFHERWVVGFGHSSVAEHAVLSIALENLSLVAVKVIENNRLSSFTEVSSRYQVFSKEKYYKPANILKSRFGKDYVKTMDELFDFYAKLTPIAKKFVEKKYPRDPKVDEKMHYSVVKGKYCDIVRYLLPLASQVNMGWTVNARNLEHALRKMFSHPLEEVRELAGQIKKAAVKITPTLLKYTDYNKYLAETPIDLARLSDRLLPKKINETHDRVKLVEYDKNADDKLVLDLLYKFSHKPYLQLKSLVKKMSKKSKLEVIDKALTKMDKHDWPIRELEHIHYTFDMCADWGGLGKDIQRHRICTQSNQLLTTELGYEIPEEIEIMGYKKEWQKMMDKVDNLYRKLAKKFPYEAQYVTTHGHRCRVLMSLNLREAHHIIKLRSTQHGHISYRRLAQAMWRGINRVHPLLAKYIRVTWDDKQTRR